MSEHTVVAEEIDGIPNRIRLVGMAHLREDAYVKMHEIVDLFEDHVHRIKYSYYLLVDGQEIGGHDREPLHDPTEHFHCTERDGGHRPGGRPSAPVSFKEAVEHAWEWLADHSAPG